MKRPGRRIAGVLAALFLLAGFWAWRDADDTLSALPQGRTTEVVADRGAVRDGRVFRHVTLSSSTLGSINFTISLPDPLPDRKMPVVIVLGGLGTGENNIRFVAAAGDNAVVGYDWPLPTAFPKGLDAVTELPPLRRRTLAIPGQIGAMLSWLVEQPWSDARRVSVLGFSLGAIAAPAVDRVAATEGIDIGWTVLAYGGAGLATLVEGDQRIRPAWVRPILGHAAAFALRPLEPARHLPWLSGHFLILTAERDTIVGAQAGAELETLTPAPKTIIHMPGDHVGTGADRRALLQAAMSVTRRWLVGEGAINPVEP